MTHLYKIVNKRIYYMMTFTLILIQIGCKSKSDTPEVITVPTTENSQEASIELTAFELGKQLFNGKGKCTSCHLTNRTSIGPSVQNIVTIYKEQDGDIVSFLKQEADPIVEPEKYAVMQTNFALLKTFKEEELKALDTYMHEIVLEYQP